MRPHGSSQVPKYSSREPSALLCSLRVPDTQAEHIHTRRQNTHTYKISFEIKLQFLKQCIIKKNTALAFARSFLYERVVIEDDVLLMF